MKGSIRQRGETSWQVRIFRGEGPGGKKQYDSFTVKGSKKDAERFLREKLHSLDRGAYTAPTKVTFKEHAERWLATYAKVHLRQTTYEGYESVLLKHAIPEIGHLTITKIAPAHLQQLYADKLSAGLGARRVQYLHTILHGCLKHAVKWGLLTRNVADSVDAPKPIRREAPALAPEQVGYLLKACEGCELEICVELAVGSGLRRGEILGLRWEDVNFHEGAIYVRRSLVPTKSGARMQEPKTSRGRRKVVLPPTLVGLLKRHKARQAEQKMRLGGSYQDHGLVCPRMDGTPWSPGAVTQMFGRLASKVGLPELRFHDLRHTHASLLLAANVHPKVVQERLGHSTISITMDTYSHLMPSLQEEAALRLDERLKVVGRR